METIKIKGKPWKVGFSFRAIREYEKLTGASISQAKSTWDNLLFFFCTLKALNKEFPLNLEEFIDYIDQKPELLAQFQTTEAPATTDEPPETQRKKKADNAPDFHVMDAFAVVVGFAGVNPGYFYDSMDYDEFMAIGQAYREDWEKTRLGIAALGAEFKLPWDQKNKAPKYNAAQRAEISKQMAGLNALNKIHLQ